jgi:hypothetical protein
MTFSFNLSQILEGELLMSCFVISRKTLAPCLRLKTSEQEKNLLVSS